MEIAKCARLMSMNAAVERAVVRQFDATKQKLLVVYSDDQQGQAFWVDIATDDKRAKETGASVLLVGDQSGNAYVLAVVESQTGTVESPKKLHTQQGAYATLSGEGESENLRVYSRDQRLLLDFDVVKGEVRFHGGEAGLRFISERDMSFQAQGRLDFSASHIALSAQSEYDQPAIAASRLRLSPQSTSISTAKHIVNSQLSQVNTKQAKLIAEESEVVSQRGRFIYDRVERMAKTILEKSKELIQEVSGTAQLNSKRSRTTVEELSYTKAKHVVVKADEDYKVKSDKIHLG